MTTFKTVLLQTMVVTLFSTSSFALEFDSPIRVKVLQKSQTATKAIALSKSIQLMNIRLTQAQRQLFTRIEPLNPKLVPVQVSKDLPAQADVGMNHTPVLDQGVHGSCVTFANTAAMDALIGKGDFISQLCSLAVGLHLEKNGHYPSGWEGSLGPIVIHQLLQLGVIDKETQKSETCGSLSEYPLTSSDTSNPMSIEEYHALSTNLNANILSQQLMTVYDRFSWKTDSQKRSAALLRKVKQSLANKPDPFDPNSASRMTFAIMLPYEFCSAGACGSYKAQFDTWTLTEAIKKDTESKIAGHEMVITGYNDNAVVYDNEGKSHQGLLTLRNSWGRDVGDKGDYYMTYEFFRQYVLEVQELIWMND